MQSITIVGMKTVGIIPARFKSTRFPGKPLAMILGKSLIQRTYENAKKARSLDSLYVATDDERIFNHVVEFGGQALYTSSECPNGSSRVAEAARNIEADIIVNIQGDEPCIAPETIDKAVEALIRDQEAVVATAATPFDSEDSRSIVKCVWDLCHRALYFSRSKISSFRHIGLYVFRRDFLFRYEALPATPLMLAEDLEQLKILEHGFKIAIAEVLEESPGVDTPDDITKVEKLLCQTTSL